jgi:lipopolysaccharide export system protein LptA
MIMKFYIALFLVLLITLPTVVMANDNPIEVVADEALEWDRANQTITARGNAIVTQGDSNIQAPTITANYTEGGNDMMIQSVIAQPNAVLTRPAEVLSANSLRADFDNGVLSSVTATENVVLKTANEVLYGDRGIYNAQTRMITVTGNVRIEQDNNVLTGTKAEFDLNTNISRLSNDGGSNGGRVRAVFGGGGQ